MVLAPDAPQDFLPHEAGPFFAGLAAVGARRADDPGIAGRETIMKNDNLALNEGFCSGSNPMVRSANLTASNPFHADMAEAEELAKPCFYSTSWRTATSTSSAHSRGTILRCTRRPASWWTTLTGSTYPAGDRAGGGGYPKDINLY